MGGWLCDGSWTAIYMDGGVMFIKKINHASPCEGHENIFGGEGKLPRVPDDIEDAMSNGSGNDEGRAKRGPLVPQVFGEVLFVGDGFGDEDEIKGEGWVWVTDIDKVGDVLVAHEEPPDIVNGSGKGISLEVRGRHGKGGVELRKAGWLVANVRRLSEDFTADASSFYNFEESRGHSSSCFLVPMFHQSIPSMLPNTDSFCLVSCDL